MIKMNFKKFKMNKKGQAAIEFLMTYGWMLLVVLIVGALLISIVDFSDFKRESVSFDNYLSANAQDSIAYSKDTTPANTIQIIFKNMAGKTLSFNVTDFTIIKNGNQGTCDAYNITNLDTAESAGLDEVVVFSPNQNGFIQFNCSSAGNLIKDSIVEGKINYHVTDIQYNLKRPGSGDFTLKAK